MTAPPVDQPDYAPGMVPATAIDEAEDRRGAEPVRPLRIGVDGTCLGSARGYGRYLRELLPPLLALPGGHEFVLVLDRETAEQAGPLPAPSIEPATRQSQAGAASARGNRSLSDMWTMGRAVAREQFDLMFFPSVYSYFPVFGGTPIAVCLHDVIAERYGAIVFPTRRNRWMWNAKVRLALRQAGGVLTVSDWSRQALAQHFSLDASRIFVSIEAPAPDFAPVESLAEHAALLADRGLPAGARTLIYVGGFNPHKNLPRLISAFAKLCRERAGEDFRLLLVGDHEGDVFHAEVGRLRSAIAAAGVAERVHWLGFVPDEELRHLYAGAELLVLPSLEEGFGLPAAEAAACGTACVATRNSPLPQLLEGGGLFVDPLDEAGLYDAIARLTADAALRDRCAQTALARARALSWKRTAEQTLDALQCIAGESR